MRDDQSEGTEKLDEQLPLTPAEPTLVDSVDSVVSATSADEPREPLDVPEFNAPAAGALRANIWIAICTTLANVAAYGFNVVLSRPLGPTRFGELVSLLAIYLLIQVPGVALQAVIARRIAAQNHGDSADVRAIIGDSLRVGIILAGAVAVCAPGLHAFLHIESWWALVWLAATTIPTTISFAIIGLLQGQQRFFGLGLLILGVQMARVAAGLVTAVSAHTVAAAFFWSFIFVTAVTGFACLRALATSDPPVEPGRVPHLVTVLARDVASILSIFILSNIDLLLAKHYLSSDEAGSLYGAGNLITKIAFWAPAFIATVSFPRFSRPAERVAAIRKSAAVCVILSGIIVIGAAVCAPLVPVILGSDYKPAGLVWAFALQGAALATVLLGVYASIAVHDRRLTWLTWIVLPAEILVIVFFAHDTSAQILATVCTGSVFLVLAAAFLERKILFGNPATLKTLEGSFDPDSTA
ncbi:O-antigen/teichoic acid export membrane protein [Jatrophihabitans sp. GAS493]|uniref:lipopolysaccharide biosynthesis protein n=1 Tax=Jatrophihabitans sp. GAS493 TaxID=1907575 RepID=UPI000BB8E7EF|nr:oligosaccharide flippase family protein [Jatrophihabitans sp. GAS493]SOD73454.1 O-antigen/teichoic acid export membrane protein [Jatrophihabitans sp. GAS493]